MCGETGFAVEKLRVFSNANQSDNWMTCVAGTNRRTVSPMVLTYNSPWNNRDECRSPKRHSFQHQWSPCEVPDGYVVEQGIRYAFTSLSALDYAVINIQRWVGNRLGGALQSPRTLRAIRWIQRKHDQVIRCSLCTFLSRASALLRRGWTSSYCM
jgi:hypothetical protein